MDKQEEMLLQVASDLNIITAEQVDQAKTAKLRDPDKSVDSVLKDLGFVSDVQLAELRAAYKKFSDSGQAQAAKTPDPAENKKDVKSSDDILKALEEHSKKSESGVSGQDKTPMEKSTIRCAKCGTEHSMFGFEKGKAYHCKNCGALLDTGTAVGEVAGLETVAFQVPTPAPAGDKPKQKDDRFIEKTMGGCKIIKKLGEGGMGAVYKATHIALAKTVAVKILPPGTAQKAQIDRFVREARTAAQLEHPNVVQVHNISEEEGFHFIVMQYVEGKTLSELVRDKGQLDIHEAIRIIRDSAKGLAAANRKRMVHRDIKPDNIMVTNDGEVKIMDFGLAKSLEAESEITRAGQVLGTPYYMSPEQCSDGKVDHQSDIYSLGVTFYFLATGQRPFTGDTPLNVMMKHLKEDMPDPKQYKPDLDDRIVKILSKMMAKEKDERYKTAAELIKDLEDASDYLKNKSASAETIPTDAVPAPKKKAEKKAGGGKGALVAAVVIVVVLGAAAAAYFGGLIPGKTGTGTSAASGTGTGGTGAGATAPVLTLEQKAENKFTELKTRADEFWGRSNFDEAIAVYDEFPREYESTEVFGKIADEKEEITKKANEHYLGVLKNADNFADNREFDKAIQSLGAFTEWKTGDIGSKAREKIVGYRELKKTWDAQARDREILRKKYEQELNNAETHYSRKEYDLAENIFKRLAEKKEFNSIAKTAAERLKDIKDIRATIRKNREDFENAARTAETAAGNRNYDLAVKTMKKYKQDNILKTEYVKKAEALITGYMNKFRTFWESEKNRADKLASANNYDGARAVVEPFTGTSESPAIASEADAFMKKLDHRRKFDALVAKARKADEYKDISDALKAMKKYAADSDPAIVEKAGKTAGELTEKLKKLIKGRFPEMVYIDGGKYTIGTTISDHNNFQQVVTLQPFYMDKTEVSNAEYAKFIKETVHRAPRHWIGGKIPAGKGNFPVVMVSYDDAVKYAEWAGKRLPTAHEWEVAAGWDPAAKARRTYPWGNKFDKTMTDILSGNKTPKPVDSYPDGRSGSGCFNMAGNVWEWTASEPTGQPSQRIIKGGSYMDPSEAGAQVTFNNFARNAARRKNIGFRCARDVE